MERRFAENQAILVFVLISVVLAASIIWILQSPSSQAVAALLAIVVSSLVALYASLLSRRDEKRFDKALREQDDLDEDFQKALEEEEKDLMK